MEAWPAVAWFLLLSHIADWLQTVNSREFTVQDIVFLYPSTTPYPGGFKCFTCEKAKDNYECNRWAPDVYCPRESRYCYSQHVMAASGESWSVTKRCASLEQCLNTGCRESGPQGHKVCTSCCEGNICNMALPRNYTDAIFATTSPLSHSQRHFAHSATYLPCLLFTLWLLT
ncbi:ly6/PLAUR domain-containing protein 6 [Hyla sarda]|uniref:ly6/PLAUR domain-containing protein 6 n=1 Tax=Hyla sarda TaxID=327740 RepID=UPI0024C47214|nr:ly6/PLAUR domain-containing protein 6 [Hyla sarda]XP_056391330.1 ly6/PLAUR domain-containing protein 6 [Hyla sarda]XP_056391331.1 ly6/PLAUR domain-containing protein 6 [Hyla sarda]XP_056391332.1 ly6/PLAUR domain-containing protein 6 [Hyla sarda]XP_056391333.1 ly6/PLAUR domain-containing protein 6 [Hyla sarda]XP_056391334.1 ly6/PLAUR domain-containing protein 6 [Hyla sarda]XP_056391335.1 ly6/PLAUR domain-containing protein 6 [Hyla sarda]XP_056391336.1 ly6/PLAUR domain-containing protein 6 